ncbi:MAG: 3-deoxy-7-phosphoheptulonate synthase, partial [Spongiibacteraceae bacterium]|nr:3-deoxy-7-phosphoheptulonate synthase [Spongiibacteraceae bacterium]
MSEAVTTNSTSGVEVLDDLNVINQEILITPDQLKAVLPMNSVAKKTVAEGRRAIKDILDHKDHR